MSKRILLTQGQFAIVDDEDYEWLNQWKWYVQKCGTFSYVARSKRLKTEKKHMTILMHRLILSACKGEDVDHINHNTFDNRKVNIRICTRAQNMANANPWKNKSSKYKGVFWSKHDKKWVTQITYNYKTIHLGYYKNEVDAAKAYDTKALELFGEFAKPNF